MDDGEGDDFTPDATGQMVRKVDCLKVLKKADHDLIKPLLIYNYEQNKHRKQQLFYDFFLKYNFDVELAFASSDDVDGKKAKIIEIINQSIMKKSLATGIASNLHNVPLDPAQIPLIITPTNTDYVHRVSVSGHGGINSGHG